MDARLEPISVMVQEHLRPTMADDFFLTLQVD